MKTAKENILSLAREYKLPFLFGVIFGLAAHASAMTNKFINQDELEYLFSKGATIDSGRWFLHLTRAVFPDASMPWINGVIALVLLSAACCVIICTFDIKSRVLQALLSAVIVTFPAEALTLTYMFTAAPYALSFLLFALSVYELTRGGWGRMALSAILFCLACGIYQAYLSLAASLFVVYIIKKLITREWTAKEGVAFGVKALGVMLVGLAVYFAVNKLVLAATATEYNDYAADLLDQSITPATILRLIKTAYLSFFYFFRHNYLQYIPTRTAQLANLVLFAAVFVCLIKCFIKDRDLARKLLWAALLLILPLAVNCILIFSFIHAVMLYGFVGVYVLAAAVLDGDHARTGRLCLHDVGALCLAVIVMCNLVYSNNVFLKQKLVYEETYGFYSTLISRIKQLPDYSDDDKIALLGDGSEQVHKASEIDTKGLIAVGDEMVSAYSRDKLLKYYMGLDCDVIDEIELTQQQLAKAASMPRYPADGGIMRDDGVIIVRLDW